MKKLFSMVLSLLLCLVFAVPAFAATASQDGVEVTLTTDKQSYSKGEEISVVVTAKNTNDENVSDVQIQNVVPEGYTLKSGYSASSPSKVLEPGQTLTLTSVYIANANGGNTTTGGTANNGGQQTNGNGSGLSNKDQSRDNTNDANPETGNNTNILLWFVGAVFSGLVIVVIVWKNKKAKNVLSIFLCVSIVASAFSGLQPEVYALEETNKTISLSKNVITDNKETKISSSVIYSLVSSSDGSSDNHYLLGDPGQDIMPDLDFEPEPATPTFNSRNEEIQNLAEINGGTTPFISCDNNNIPSYIDGRFSDKIVKSSQDAIDALNDIHHIMQFENAEQEFVEVYADTVGNTVFYRLQQVYHNVDVSRHQLVIATDRSGVIQSLTGHYYPNLNMDTSPQISMEKAREIVRRDSELDRVACKGLNVYTHIGKTPELVWIFKTFYDDYTISANDGRIITVFSTMISSDTGTGTDFNGDTVEFPISIQNNEFVMSDESRKIEMYDAQGRSAPDDILKYNDNNPILWSNHPEAISLYANIRKTYDYYLNVLGRNGTDNKGRTIQGLVCWCGGWTNIFKVHVNCKNAYAMSGLDGYDLIYFGHLLSYSTRRLDVVAHEFTHSVSYWTWESNKNGARIQHYLNAAGAINDAYSDILGSLIYSGSISDYGEKENGEPSRTPSKPVVSTMAQAEAGFCYKEGDHKDHVVLGQDCDNGHVHDNSTLLTYVAYLIDQNWPTANHGDELATLFYKSMYFLATNNERELGFVDFGSAVLASAKSMNMSQEKQQVIIDSLNKVGIHYKDGEATLAFHHIIGEVKNAKTKEGIPNVQVYGTRTSWGIGGGVAYTDWNGNYDLRLTQGTYDISFFVEGYHSQTIENVELSAFDFEHALETVYLTPIGGEEQETVFAQGKVLDSEIKNPLAGATVKFREGTDNQTGDYIQITEGLDITLTTDESGQYYTSALPAGSYTLEASKDGYVTGYLNIVSGNSDECSTQNILLTPVSSDRIFWNGHYYQVFGETLKWSEAKKLCEDQGGHLITITSQEEHDFIQSTLSQQFSTEFRRFWIVST